MKELMLFGGITVMISSIFGGIAGFIDWGNTLWFIGVFVGYGLAIAGIGAYAIDVC